MNPKQPKKMLILDILDILRRRSDVNHRLSQKDIVDYLKLDFGMTADRKTVARNLADLIDEGLPIGFRKVPRITRNPATGEECSNAIATDYYFEHEFSEAELRLLIDGIIFSRHIAPSQRRALIKKLEGLSSMHFKSRVKHVSSMPRDQTDNKQLFYTIDLLDEAISRKRKVSFKYITIGPDKKAHARRRRDGSERVYVCTPYQMAVNEGKYYLICSYDKYDDVTNYRVDRIIDLEILDERGKPFNSLIGADGQGLDLEQYMREHIYMYAGGTVRATFRIVKRMTGDIIDIFGSKVRFFNETDDSIDVETLVNENAMIRFCCNFAPDVVLLSPQNIVARVQEQLCAALGAYVPSP